MRCPVCRSGEVESVASEGRTWKYRNIPDLSLSEPISIPTCQSCGESFVDAKLAARLDQVLAPEYERQLSKKAVDALEILTESGIRQRELEPLLGLSAGYLSKVKKGKDTSAQLVSALMLLAVEPGAPEKLKRLWSSRADLSAERKAAYEFSVRPVAPGKKVATYIPSPDLSDEVEYAKVIPLRPRAA